MCCPRPGRFNPPAPAGNRGAAKRTWREARPARIDVVTLIYLVQHGEKERGPGDPGLTALGREQSAVTARWFRRIEVTAVYSSPLRRARQTAAPIAATAGLAVRVDKRLRERVNWEGAEPLGRFLADWHRAARDRDFVPGTGESSRSAGERLRGFVVGLAGREWTVVAVSHGGVTTDLLRTLAGDDAVHPRLLDDGIPACAITILEDLEVITIASTGHLRGTTA
jgi:broad specificity phosphatase PhoE